jgi:hypothetical protein
MGKKTMPLSPPTVSILLWLEKIFENENYPLLSVSTFD